MSDYIKCPLRYTGNKYKLLSQILPLFPKNINTFVDLFAGSYTVGINVNANNYVCNDMITYLIEFFDFLKNNDLNKNPKHFRLINSMILGIMSNDNKRMAQRQTLCLWLISLYVQISHFTKFHQNP